MRRVDLGVPNAEIPYRAAMTWYARGVAFAALKEVPAAQRALVRLQSIAADHRADETGTALQIAIATLEGEIALRNGRPLDAVHAFQKAVTLEDRLTYNEPPTWYYPVRHSLGLALLAAGRPRDAEWAYRQDLARFPNTVWSLLGLTQSLAAQSRTLEATTAKRHFERAALHVDLQLTGSSF